MHGASCVCLGAQNVSFLSCCLAREVSLLPTVTNPSPSDKQHSSPERAFPAAPHLQKPIQPCPSPPRAHALGGQRARGRATALWEGEENQWAGSLRAFRPAEGLSLLGRRPVPTFVTQPSTACLLLKLSSTSFLTSRRVSSKRGHLCFQVLRSSMLPPGRLQSLLLLSLHTLTW